MVIPTAHLLRALLQAARAGALRAGLIRGLQWMMDGIA